MEKQFYFMEQDYDGNYAEVHNRNRDYVRTECEICGRPKVTFDKAQVLELVGRKKANFYCGSGIKFDFYVDEKLENLLTENNITGISFKEIEKYNSSVDGLKEMVIEGRAGYLRKKNGELLEKCEKCNCIVEDYSEVIGATIMEEDWDGADIFLIENYRGIPVVTRKVKELFEGNKIKNTIFTLIEEFELGC